MNFKEKLPTKVAQKIIYYSLPIANNRKKTQLRRFGLQTVWITFQYFRDSEYVLVRRYGIR